MNICIYKSCEPHPEAQAGGGFGAGMENEGRGVKSCEYVHDKKTKVFLQKMGGGFSPGKAEKCKKYRGWKWMEMRKEPGGFWSFVVKRGAKNSDM